MASRRRTLHRWAPRSGAEQAAAGVIALVAVLWLVQAVTAMGRWLLTGWPVLVGPGVISLVALGVWGRRRAMADRQRSRRLARLRLSLAEIDTLDDRQFEFALRDLMIRDGCTARRVGQQGDQAADVIAQHPRQGRIVLQAKHTTVGGKVSSHVMYQVKGTAGPVHGADIGIVVTNGSLTQDAGLGRQTPRLLGRPRAATTVGRARYSAE